MLNASSIQPLRVEIGQEGAKILPPPAKNEGDALGYCTARPRNRTVVPRHSRRSTFLVRTLENCSSRARAAWQTLYLGHIPPFAQLSRYPSGTSIRRAPPTWL